MNIDDYKDSLIRSLQAQLDESNKRAELSQFACRQLLNALNAAQNFIPENNTDTQAKIQAAIAFANQIL